MKWLLDNWRANTIFQNTIKRFWPAILIGAAWLWIFLPMMIGEEVVGFRDSAYLYYPLFKWIDAQWAAGVIPLWNPFCNFGMPVVHDGSSSVFYPGKLIFFLRVLPYPARYGIYIAIHVPIAATGTYWMARTLKASQVGSTLAAFAFAFSGAVLFQTTNVVYLVSAAWLPFALCCVWLMFRQLNWKWSVWTAMFCSLMILGGDPQMCYHVGLIMCAFAIWKWWRTRRRFFRCSNEMRDHGRQFRVASKSMLLILAVVGITFLLSAIQVLPSYVWSQDSIRAARNGVREVPRNVSEVFSNRKFVNEKLVREGLLGAPRPNTHHDHIYQFSQPPWALAELVWPNVSGRPYPIHQRWVDALPGAERMWTPSIYAGCFVFLLACVAFNPFSRNRKFAWLSRLAMFFAIASFGWYGPVWLASEVAPQWMAKQNLGSPVGGLYWLMVVLLPKYVAFRYPAKLMTIATLAICVLAGLSLDRVLRKQRLRGTARAAACAALGSLGMVIFGSRLAKLAEGTASEMFGPYDLAGCERGIFAAALMGISVPIVCWMVLRLNPSRRKFAGAIVLMICAIEILMMNSWLVPTVQSDVFESESRWTEWGKDNPAAIVNRDPALSFPGEWGTEHSIERLSRIVSWQRETLQYKHHLNHRIQLIGSFYSIEPSQTHAFRGQFMIPLHGSCTVTQGPEGLVLTKESTQKFFLRPIVGPRESSFAWVDCNHCLFSINANSDFSLERHEFEARMQFVPGWRFSARDVDTNKPLKLAQGQGNDSMKFEVESRGNLEVIASYEPHEFFVGAWISVIGWFVLILFGSVTLTALRKN